MKQVIEFIQKRKGISILIAVLIVFFVAGSVVRCNHVHAPSDAASQTQRTAQIIYKSDTYLIEGNLLNVSATDADEAEILVGSTIAERISEDDICVINPLKLSGAIFGRVSEISETENGIQLSLMRNVSSTDVFEAYQVDGTEDELYVSGGVNLCESNSAEVDGVKVVYESGLLPAEGKSEVNIAEIDNQLASAFIDLRGGYESDTKTLIDNLKAHVWASGDSIVVRFHDTYMNVINSGKVSDVAYVIQAQEASSESSQDTNTQDTIFAITSQDGTSLAHLSRAEKDGDVSLELSIPQFTNSRLKPIEVASMVELEGPSEDVCNSLGVSIEKIEQAVSEYCAVFLPTTHSGTWTETLNMDYKLRKSSIMYELDNSSNSIIKVGVSWDDFGIDVESGS